MKILNGLLGPLIVGSMSCGSPTVSDRGAATQAEAAEEESAEELAIRNGNNYGANGNYDNAVTIIVVTRPTFIDGVVGEAKSFCSATVVDSKRLLTAAHCLARLWADGPVLLKNIQTPAVVAGLKNKVGQGDLKENMLSAAKVYMFPGFTGKTEVIKIPDPTGSSKPKLNQIQSSVDLALIEFASIIKDAKPSTFITSKKTYTKHSHFRIFGYGINPTDRGFYLGKGDVLHTASLPTLVNAGDKVSGFRSLMVRARNTEVACSGDSGGPAKDDSRVTGISEVIGIMSASFSTAAPDAGAVDRCLKVTANTYTGVTQGDVVAAKAELAKLSLAQAEVESTIVVPLDNEFDGLTVVAKTLSSNSSPIWDNTFFANAGYTGLFIARAVASQSPNNTTALWSTLSVTVNGNYKIRASYKPQSVNTKCAQYEFFDNANSSVKTFATLDHTAPSGSQVVMQALARTVNGAKVDMVMPLVAGKFYSVKLTGRCDGVVGKYMQADAVSIVKMN